MKRTELRRTNTLRPSRQRNKTSPGAREWYAARKGYCEHPRCPGWSGQKLVLHHAVYAQHVERLGGDVWDVRNAVTLCHPCHMAYHANRDFPVMALPDSVIEFACLLMGEAAPDYFRRYYRGANRDSRLYLRGAA